MMQLPTRYSKVKKTLPGGGMSDTLVCFDSNLERDVVVKTLKSGIEKHRLIDELAALADIRSKYVVQVLDVIYDGTEIVGFVEEYIDGEGLKPVEVGTSGPAALRYLYSVAAGIADIHEHGRVHRDIKPDNMKVDGSGVLKIFDFGLAKLSTDAKTKELFYTPSYTPPEVFKPDDTGHHVFTPAVDVFAFGVTALWLLNGGKLFSELSHIPPTLPANLDAFSGTAVSVPVEIAALLNACLNPDPALRPSASSLRTTIGKQLLFDKHRMLLTYRGTANFVDATSRDVTISSGNDAVTISYNGLDFVVTKVAGHVRHNNRQVSVSYVLHGASVIVLGHPGAGAARTSITADISHPEVMN